MGRFVSNMNWNDNIKQIELLHLVISEIKVLRSKGYDTDNAIRHIFFGGGIRGGKTYGILGIVILLAKWYPRSRWTIIRKSLKELKNSTIPSVEKILLNCKVRWHRTDSDYYVEFKNGSRLYFLSENLDRDPNLVAFDGHETNGFVLEQIEGISKKMFDKAISRAGSWYTYDNKGNPNTPPSFVFSSFNPTSTWVKDEIYLPAMAGTLKPPRYFIEALSDNNPHVTEDQKNSWKNMSSKEYKRMVEGDWTFKAEDSFMWSFDKTKHVFGGYKEYEEGVYTCVSMDFNADPMCGIIFQTDGKSYMRVLDEIHLHNVGIPDVCKYLDNFFRDNGMSHQEIFWTGDAKGQDRNKGLRGAISDWEQIVAYFRIDSEHFRVSSSNPRISDSWRFCNTVMEKLDVGVHSGCNYLVRDLEFSLKGMNNKGHIKKVETGINPYNGVSNSVLWHTLDTWRYAVHCWFYDSVVLYES